MEWAASIKQAGELTQLLEACVPASAHIDLTAVIEPAGCPALGLDRAYKQFPVLKILAF